METLEDDLALAAIYVTYIFFYYAWPFIELKDVLTAKFKCL